MFHNYLYTIYGYVTKYITVTVKGKIVRVPIRKLGVVRYERKESV